MLPWADHARNERGVQPLARPLLARLALAAGVALHPRGVRQCAPATRDPGPHREVGCVDASNAVEGAPWCRVSCGVARVPERVGEGHVAAPPPREGDRRDRLGGGA